MDLDRKSPYSTYTFLKFGYTAPQFLTFQNEENKEHRSPRRRMSSWLVVIDACLANILIPPSLVLFVVLANACSLTQTVTDPEVQGIKF